MSKKSKLIVVLILCSWANAQAQKQATKQNLLWTRYFLKLKVSDSYQVRQEIEERVYWFPWRQHQFVSRTHLEKKLGNGWNTAFGFTYFLQSLPQLPDIVNYTQQLELRPQLELAYKQNISEKIGIHHRYWLEFRFFEQAKNSFDYGNSRIRYKIEVSYASIEKLTIKAFNEIHLNLGKDIIYNVFDQNRYGASLQFMPIERFGIELGYFNWFQQRSTGIDFYNRHIVRCTFIHNISLK